MNNGSQFQEQSSFSETPQPRQFPYVSSKIKFFNTIGRFNKHKCKKMSNA
jgi:hypothetical protein